MGQQDGGGSGPFLGTSQREWLLSMAVAPVRVKNGTSGLEGLSCTPSFPQSERVGARDSSACPGIRETESSAL
jgi:hypothetical protein